MKIRKGFVSNSSSSSFVCDICGRTESGMDVSEEEFGYVRCEYEHLICEEEALEGYRIYSESDLEEEPELASTMSEHLKRVVSDEYSNIIAKEYCPICQFESPCHEDIKKYFLKTSDITEDTVFEEVKKNNKRRKKLYPYEYTDYVLKAQGRNISDMLLFLKEKFGDYSNFRDFLRN